jgi:hypothetical protein
MNVNTESNVRLDLERGTILCVHVPDWDSLDLAFTRIANQCTEGGLKCLIAELPKSRSCILEMIRRMRSTRWLAKHGGVSAKRAESIIEEMPIDVYPILYANAFNPYEFLAYSAAILQSPDVVVFQTAGQDPIGRTHLFQYIADTLGNAMAVHVNLANLDGSFICPEGARCRQFWKDDS